MEIQDAKQARPHCELIAELLDSRQPKTEREHAAVREIERLRHDIERHIAIASEYATECERLRAELAACREDAEKWRAYAARKRAVIDAGMGKIILRDTARKGEGDLDEYHPHCHGTITCSFCGYVWVGVWPVDTQMLECKNCGGLNLIARKGEGE